MLWEHLSVSCVPIIQRTVVPVSILQPGWQLFNLFQVDFFCPALNMIRLIEYFVTLSVKFVTVLPSILFPCYVKLLSIQCFPIDIEYKVKTFLIEKEFLCKNWIFQKYWNEIEIFCSSMCSSLVPRASLCYKINNITIIQLQGLTVLIKTQLHNTEIDRTYIFYSV